MSLDSHSCLWNDWASGPGVSGAQACKCLIYLLLWQLRHQGLSFNSLLPSSCSQQKGHLHWTSPTAQEGEKPEPQTSRTQGPVLGLPLSLGSPRRTLTKPWKKCKCWTAPGRRGFRAGNYPDSPGRETQVQIKNTLKALAG